MIQSISIKGVTKKEMGKEKLRGKSEEIALVTYEKL